MSRFSLIYIGTFSLLLSVISFFNIIYSNYFKIHLTTYVYSYIFVFTLIIGIILIFFKNANFKKINIYEKIILVIFGYIFFPLIISFPYFFTFSDLSFVNSYFEGISGFTSTGFTIFENIKQLDQSLILWRSTSQWLGGLYFLFSLLLLIDIFDENLKKSITNYISFNSSEITKQALKIVIIYSTLTLFILLFLKLIGIRFFDALNLSFTIISSGGFLSTTNINFLFTTDIAKLILSILILVSFFSLFFLYNIIFFKKKNLNYLSEDFYLFIYLTIVISIFFIFFKSQNNFFDILLAITSSVSNIGISFSPISINLSFLFLILVIIGGSFFSTSSGLRIVKVINLIKFSINNILSNTKPKQIYLNKVNLINSQTTKDDVYKYFLAIILFLVSLTLITTLLSISNIDFEKAFKVGILTIMNTTNSDMFGLQEFDFNNISNFAKMSLMIFMIIGRVEFLTFLILLKKFLFKN